MITMIISDFVILNNDLVVSNGSNIIFNAQKQSHSHIDHKLLMALILKVSIRYEFFLYQYEIYAQCSLF